MPAVLLLLSVALVIQTALDSYCLVACWADANLGTRVVELGMLLLDLAILVGVLGVLAIA